MVVWKVGNSFVSFFSFLHYKKNCDNEDFYPCVAAFDILSAKIFLLNLSAKILNRKSFQLNAFFFRKVLQTPPMLFLLRLWLCAHAFSDERPVAFSLADYLINLSPVW